MEWTIWSPILWVLNIFSRIGNTWATGTDSTGVAQLGNDAVYYFGEQTPLVARILSEIRTGFSLQTILEFWGPLLQIPILITLVFGASMLYCAIRVYQIRQIEKVNLQMAAHVPDSHEAPRTKLRWQRVLESASSDDPQQWRSAILEADHMLNELLDTLGYKGETMTDKLRKADVTVFKTIDFAWEAHKVRDSIAQDPSFALDARETKRIIKIYERVFEEFHFIDGGHDEHHEHSH